MLLRPFSTNCQSSSAAAEDSEIPSTEKQARRDFNSLLHGRHGGRLVIENIKPKLTADKRKIVDETFKDVAQFKKRKTGK